MRVSHNATAPGGVGRPVEVGPDHGTRTDEAQAEGQARSGPPDAGPGPTGQAAPSLRTLRSPHRQVTEDLVVLHAISW